MDEVENFLANFQILGPLGCQGWVVIPQNVKKSKSLHPYLLSMICMYTYIDEGVGMGLFMIGGHWPKILPHNSKGAS
jgi:hypothetical protein